MKKLSILVFFLFTFNSAFAQNSAKVQVVEPEVYKLAIKEGPKQFVDIRTSKEYDRGYIEGAENVDFLRDDFLLNMQKFDKEKPLYIYCRSGNRSSKAAAKLTEDGFTNIIDLKGGFKAWNNVEKE